MQPRAHTLLNDLDVMMAENRKSNTGGRFNGKMAENARQYCAFMFLSPHITNTMPIQIRPASRTDIPGMHRVRLAVRENRLTSTAITEKHYLPAIEETGKGWVAVEDGEVRGFAVGNKETGNIWALFVDPNAEGQGIGRKLHDEMTAWLFAQGLVTLSLGTAPGTRAQRFYERAGWTFVGIHPGGEALYTFTRPIVA
jgi:GNAT superfamily N-acetyltransferase